MVYNNLYELTAKELRDKFLSNELSAEEIVSSFYERIEKVEDKIKSFVSLRKDIAIDEAKKLDEKKKNGEKLGRLAGIPIAIKDNILMEGQKSTSCSKILENYIGIYDSTVVKKLKEEGVEIVALEITDKSIDYTKYIPNREKGVCLVLGREYDGVSKEIIDIADYSIHLPIYGMCNSINVSTAASVAMYDILEKLKKNSSEKNSKE